MKLYFITPAFKRFRLSSICFRERQWAISKLRKEGIDANCVVVADDVNRHIAASLGFDIVVAPNDYLGRKFNHGYEFAAKQGADLFCPIGSDSWIDPEFIMKAMGLGINGAFSSRNYAVVDKLGERRAQLFVEGRCGTTFVFPRAILEKVNFRPAREEIHRGCDNSTMRRSRSKPKWVEVHDLETVAFQSDPQISDFLMLRKRWGKGLATTKGKAVFDDLKEFYPRKLVEEMQRFYHAV